MRDKAPHCIFCWESIDGEIMQPLFAGPGAQQGAEPIAWVHKDCLEEYTTDPSEYEPKVIAVGAELSESGADDDEDVSSELGREDMSEAALWERAIADLVEIERRQKDAKITAIIRAALDASSAK
jgi:hypothetical protein